VAIKALEWRGVEAVPAAARHGKASHLFPLWFAANLGFPAWVIGPLAVTLQPNWVVALLAVAVGAVIGSLLVAIAAALGPASGLGSLPQSQRAFGRLGVKLPALLNFVSCAGWFAVNTVLGTEAVQRLLHLPAAPAFVVMAAVQVGLAVFGYDMIHRVERVASVVLLLLFLYLTVHTAVGTTGPLPAPGPVGWPMAILTVAISASYLFSWGPYAADYSRYLPADTPARSVFWWTFWGSFVSTSGVMVLGVVMAVRFHLTGTMTLLAAGAGRLAPIAYLAVVGGTVTADVLNVYTGATSTLTLGVGKNRVQAAMLTGLLGSGLAIIGLNGGFATQYENFLLLLSYWVAPWLAILFWDAVQPGDGTRRLGPGIWSLIVGVATSVPFMSQTLWTGWVAQAWGGADVAYYVGFLVAGVTYWWWGIRPRAGQGVGAPSAHVPG
jgi:NCS1 family nucleobase:cation symporter-1